MHEVLVNRLGGLRLPRKSVVRLTDRSDMTLDVYRGRKTTMQQQQHCLCVNLPFHHFFLAEAHNKSLHESVLLGVKFHTNMKKKNMIH